MFKWFKKKTVEDETVEQRKNYLRGYACTAAALLSSDHSADAALTVSQNVDDPFERAGALAAISDWVRRFPHL